MQKKLTWINMEIMKPKTVFLVFSMLCKFCTHKICLKLQDTRLINNISMLFIDLAKKNLTKNEK